MGNYFVEEDIKVIEEWAKRKNLNVSFREAGADTIKCLKRGAGAKPHAILDKTIKGDSIAVKNFFECFGGRKVEAENLLKGLVGHWINNKSVIDGLYLTEAGQKVWKEKYPQMVSVTEDENVFLKLSEQNSYKVLMDYYETLKKAEGAKAEYYFSRCFFSGDYDMHDLYQVNAPVASMKDVELIVEVQGELLEARKKQLMKMYGLSKEDFAEESNADYCRIQHGPQCNYIAQMINENVRAKNMSQINALVDVVCRPSLPVNMFFSGKEQNKQKGLWKEIVSHQALIDEINKMGNTVTQTKEFGVTKEELEAIKEQIEQYKVSTVKHAIKLAVELTGKPISEVQFNDIKDKCSELNEKYKKEFEKYFNEAKKTLTNL